MKCTQAMDTGAYVLGALAPTERESYEAHLAKCPECRHEVAQLAVLPGLLARLEPGVAETIAREGRAATEVAPPDTLLVNTLQEMKARRTAQRRRRRWQAVGALVAAGCLAAGVTVVVDNLDDRRPSSVSDPVVTMAHMRSLAPQVPIQADVALVPVSGGTQVWMHCWYDPSSHNPERWTFRLVAITSPGGDERELTYWQSGDGDDVMMKKFTNVPAPEITRLEVRFQTMTVLEYEPT
jgi:Putative zinc-finger